MRFLKAKVLLVGVCALMASNVFAACKYTNTINIPPAGLAESVERRVTVWLANTSNHPLDVTLEIFDNNGNDVTNSVVQGGPTQSFVGKGAGYFFMSNSSFITVHGRLTWTSQECLRKPLLGNQENTFRSGTNLIPLQQGKRF